jgi:transcriptional regulator with XRE-family HTH domain
MYKTPERLAFDKELGAAIRRYRLAAGLNRNDVAADTDLNPSSIDRIERGESSTNLFDILRVMASIGVDPATFLQEVAAAGEARFSACQIWRAAK